MEAIFKVTPRFSTRKFSDVLQDLYLNKDFWDYLQENEGVELIVSLKPKAKVKEKELMYAFYHGPLLEMAIRMYTDFGYESMDKVKADYLLKGECATSTMIRNGREEPYLEDKARMSKKRLNKFINDCLLFLEMNGYHVPDSSEYKSIEHQGLNATFKPIKKDWSNGNISED